MFSKVILWLFLFLILQGVNGEIQKIDLPLIDKHLQDDINFQMNFLKLLVPTFNWVFCNKQLLDRTVRKTSLLLHKAAKQMKLQNGNIVHGTGNQVMGMSNVIIGSNNNFVGLSSWCFTSNYQTP